MTAVTPLFEDPSNGAVVDGDYRYSLWRTWTGSRSPALCAWIMLNPSTADAAVDDPTVRRCCGYAKRWGFDGIVIRNLFALRATNPTELIAADDPVGPENDRWLTSRWDGVVRTVVAWGSGRYPRLRGERWKHVASLLEPRNPLCLRVARDGQPVHPLYQRADLEPCQWRPPTTPVRL